MDDKAIGDLYRQAGSLIFRRCLKLLGDAAAAEDATQEVFLKLMTHVEGLDPAGGYLPWIYRVATNHCLNRLRDGARLEIRDPEMLPELPDAGSAAALPERALGAQVLRRFDAETRSIAVLVLCDGLTQDEAAAVLGLSRKTVGKKLRRFLVDARKFIARVYVSAPPHPSGQSRPVHPSDMALDAGGEAIAGHIGECAACGRRAEAGRLARERFEMDVLPRTLPVVRERLARRRWRLRAIWIAAPALAAAALVLALRAPMLPPAPADPAWTGVKGAGSRPMLEIYVKRGDRVSRFEPGQRLRAGDALRWIVRADRGRFLTVNSRDAAGHVTHVFPAGGEVTAALVHPGDELPGSAVLDATPGSEVLTAVFADKPFPIDGEPPDGSEVVRIEIPKEDGAQSP